MSFFSYCLPFSSPFSPPFSFSIKPVATSLPIASPKLRTDPKWESRSSVGNNASSISLSSSSKRYDDRLLGLGLADGCLANILSYLSCGDLASLFRVSRTLNRRVDFCGWKIRAKNMGFSEEDIKIAGGARLVVQQAFQTEAAALYKLKALIKHPSCYKEFISIPHFYLLSEEDKTASKNIGEKSAQSIREIKDFFSKNSQMQSATYLLLHNDHFLTGLPTSSFLTQLPTSNLTFASVISASFYKLPLQQPSKKSQHAIPRWVFQLPKLEQLTLQNLGLTEIPDDIRFCSKLTKLCLSNSFEKDGRLENPNRIISLPAALSSLPLTKLALNGLDLPLIPQEVYQLADLTDLEINDNPRLKLPSSFTQLQNLNSLCMENIGLTDWPPALLELNQLIDLKIGRNKLVDIPDRVARWLSSVISLDARPNPWSSEAIEILEKKRLRRIKLAFS